MMTSQIAYNLNQIKGRIQQACTNSGRNPETVKVLLATKTVPAEKIKEALSAGYRLIAENKVQELQEKYLKLLEEPHVSHFIGHLQRNKIKELLNSDVSCIHSIDRFELAEQLDYKLATIGEKWTFSSR